MTVSTKLASRVFFTRWAICSIIQSSGFSSHRSLPGARYKGLVKRRALTESW